MNLKEWQRQFDQALRLDAPREFHVGDRVRVMGGKWDALRGTIVAIEPPQGNSIGAMLIDPERTGPFGGLLAPVWIQRRYVLHAEPEPVVTCTPGDTHFVNSTSGGCQCGLITGVVVHRLRATHIERHSITAGHITAETITASEVVL